MILPRPANLFSDWVEFFRKDFGHDKKIDLKAFLLIDLLIGLILVPIVAAFAFL